MFGFVCWISDSYQLRFHLTYCIDRLSACSPVFQWREWCESTWIYEGFLHKWWYPKWLRKCITRIDIPVFCLCFLILLTPPFFVSFLVVYERRVGPRLMSWILLSRSMPRGVIPSCWKNFLAELRCWAFCRSILAGQQTTHIPPIPPNIYTHTPWKIRG